MTTAQPQDKYIVRFPDGMRDQLKELAASSGRSLNKQIVWMLCQQMEYSSVIEEILREWSLTSGTSKAHVGGLAMLMPKLRAVHIAKGG